MTFRLAHIFINVSYHILVASLTLMALFNRAIRVRLATSIYEETLMKIVLRIGASLGDVKI